MAYLSFFCVENKINKNKKREKRKRGQQQSGRGGGGESNYRVKSEGDGFVSTQKKQRDSDPAKTKEHWE